MKTLVKRPSANTGYADEANPSKFYLVRKRANNKTYFLAETSEGNYEWLDLGSRDNLSNQPHNSFEAAIGAVENEQEFELTEHETRMGALTNLLDRTREAVRNQEQISFSNNN